MDPITRERVKVSVAGRISEDPSAPMCMKTKCQGLVSKCVNTVAACKEISRGVRASAQCDQQVNSCKNSYLLECATLCSKAYFGEEKRAQCLSECLNSKCYNPTQYGNCISSQIAEALASCIEKNCGDTVRKCMTSRCNISFPPKD
ncbi:hypothetical protein GpartN1_g6646.t1 [Galdieria partita]|uniref:Uncharacterized protein n=1 Tax=Galdieria partita TaxID=83374 RepID=A0A9C7Q2I1_9RHOD|nr:hypothetical protein GpartN1_g929.t1 [Galdieria partita]GJQ14855.1 hypothetical protein GpartN1_g6646.t1 [Galdieria partita]